MVRDHSGMNAAARYLRLLSLAVFSVALGGAAAWADETVSFSHGIDLPKGSNPLKAYDISFVDTATGIYILADRSNSGVDVFSVVGQQFLFRVGGFAGAQGGKNDIAGPNGVLTVHHREIWAGDGNNAGDGTQSSVKVIDLLTQKITDTIVIPHGQARADEMAWDRDDEILLVANDADTPPFITFISTKHRHKVLGQIFFPEATNGIEQSQWSPKTGLFYLNLPEVNPNTGEGQVVVIDPHKLRIVHRFATHDCEAAGLALGPDNQALLGCAGGTPTNSTKPLPNESQVIDIRNGHVIATFPEVGGSDEVWFNPGDNHYYLAARSNASGPVLGTIDAETLEFDNNATTVAGAHSVAADPIFDNIFVPLNGGATGNPCQDKATGCIGVYRHGPLDGDDKDRDDERAEHHDNDHRG